VSTKTNPRKDMNEETAFSVAPMPEAVKAARKAAGLTQQAAADRFGYKLRSWQRKEEAGATGTALSQGEYEFLLLLAGLHPDYVLNSR